MKTLAFLLLLLLSFSAAAFEKSCWVLTKLKGVGTYQSHDYKLETDGFSHSITLIFGGSGAIASGDSIGLSQSDDYAAAGAASNANFSVAETYLVNPMSSTVLYTKSTFGYGAFIGMTGTKMFTGKATKCR
ncbi:hypothetical protein [Paralcaligenes ureilyticus]|uniref:Uncharacterized protein n=1 Tax=Paralcaligenes ureilyticus TaxID=627131 RepID=A0A4V2UZ10_9BURK|nr:hypothetical protein [Paralcaligenes ureilyticus]TCT09488.1 hypothetical protein EDC26_103106 [Paralcaligenes ureilyticus]